MARFLSPEWFDEVARPDARPRGGAVERDADDLVLEQVVRDTPEGEVRYRVVVTAGTAYLEPPATPATPAAPASPADLTITCSWETAAAMAQGQLSAQTALMEGRLRVRGDMARLSGRAADLVGLDPVPDDVRRRTTY